MMNRREMLRRTGAAAAALGLGHLAVNFPLGWTAPGDKIDPYIAMLGGEFIVHGDQQKANMKVVDNAFPGAKDLKDFVLLEEWYALKNFAPDIHVVLVQDTTGMKGGMYERPDFPAT